jgi:hypothetical protein
MQMNWPPLLLHLRLPSREGFLGLWLPWFLVYPILLALMLIALPFILVAAIFLVPGGRARPLLMAGPYIWRLLFALRGLKMDIETGGREMMVDFV